MSGFDGANTWRFHPALPGTSATLSSAVLENARSAAGASMVMRHGVFHCGSSKPGNARRALIASNCVMAYHSPASRCRKSPRVSSGSMAAR